MGGLSAEEFLLIGIGFFKFVGAVSLPRFVRTVRLIYRSYPCRERIPAYNMAACGFGFWALSVIGCQANQENLAWVVTKR